YPSSFGLLMPLINYVCDCGEVFKKYYKTAKDALLTVECKCGSKAKKAFGTTSSSHKTVIDNGLMSRRLEIDPNIQEINDDRSAKDYSEED
ncbi:MAG TPA: hypothetical protein VIJ14_02875, partial [Rhabdochlamydiaceae bacterium]